MTKMDNFEIERTRLRLLERRLRVVGKINLGLIVVLLAGMVYSFFQISALIGMEPEAPGISQGIDQVIASGRHLRILAFVCLGLLLVWGPSRFIVLMKLKKLDPDPAA